jgi:hypothetical protein
MPAVRHRSTAWADSAAFAWAAAYAIGVRGYLGLGVLVSLATLHHYRRTGGSARGGRLLMLMTVTATVAISAFACALVVIRSQ